MRACVYVGKVSVDEWVVVCGCGCTFDLTIVYCRSFQGYTLLVALSLSSQGTNELSRLVRRKSTCLPVTKAYHA